MFKDFSEGFLVIILCIMGFAFGTAYGISRVDQDYREIKEKVRIAEYLTLKCNQELTTLKGDKNGKTSGK